MPAITYTLTNAGHNLFRDASKGAANPKISYVALGTGSTAPTTGDTKLQAEVYRKAISSYTNGANPGNFANHDTYSIIWREVEPVDHLAWIGPVGITANGFTIDLGL